MAISEFHSNLLTRAQAERIVEILTHQCNRVEERNNFEDQLFSDLHDAQYGIGRTHGNTEAVYSGFQEDTEIPEMTVHKIKYGRHHWQPEIVGVNSVIQLYSSDASLDIKEIQDKCARYNVDDSDKRYGVLQFWMSDKGHLTKVDIVEFDCDAQEIMRESLYKFRATVRKLIA